MDTKQPTNAYTVGCWGGMQIHEAFEESFKGLEGEMHELGFEAIDRRTAGYRFEGMPIDPESWEPSKWTMDAQQTHEFIAFMVFIVEPITKAVIEVAAARFFEHVLPRLRKMFKPRKRPSDNLGLPFKFRPSMFFEAEQVVVTVIVDINTREEFETAEILIPLAFQRAGAWLEKHGRVEPYMTYRIRNGQLNNFPTLSAQEPTFAKKPKQK